MSKVFVVHEPSFWDRTKKRMVPMDIAPADKFGQRVVIFPGPDRPPRGEKAIPRMAEALATYTRNDFLLVSGHTDLLIWACVLAFRAGNGLTLLKWNNRERDYEAVPAPASLCA